MALRQVELDDAMLRDNDGTVGMSMRLWSSRFGPTVYNQWQSAYFQLLRKGFRDENVIPDETQAQLQVRLRAMHKRINEEFHGPDFLALAIVRESPRAQAIDPDRGLGDQIVAAVPIAAPAPAPQGVDRGSGGSAALSVVYSQAPHTPERDSLEIASDSAGSPDTFLLNPEYADVWNQYADTHTEATSEAEERMQSMADHLAGHEHRRAPASS